MSECLSSIRISLFILIELMYLLQVGTAADGVSSAAVGGARQPHRDASVPSSADAVPVLAVFAVTLPHRQALPAPLLLEVLQHSSHPPVRRPHRHASLLRW